MRKPLKKTEYLLQLESVLKEYGYTEMYCVKGFDKFDGTKKGGLLFVINAERNKEVNILLNSIVDPTWDLDDAHWEDMSGVSIRVLTDADKLEYSPPVYIGGEFYAID